MPSDPAGTGHWETDTQPLSRPPRDTLELPAVTEDVTPEPAQAPAPRPVPAAAPVARPRRRSGVSRWLAVTVLLVLVAAAVTAVGLARHGRPLGSARSGAGAGSALAIRAVSSVDPSGGSGWRRSGASPATAVWRTQHYASADFGGLKPGVGLLIDLGTSRRVISVRTTVGVAGTTVELRAADSTSAAGQHSRLLDTARAASGVTTLRAKDGGTHRYWLVWVPRLGRDGGGYSAVLRGLSVRG